MDVGQQCAETNEALGCPLTPLLVVADQDGHRRMSRRDVTPPQRWAAAVVGGTGREDAVEPHERPELDGRARRWRSRQFQRTPAGIVDATPAMVVVTTEDAGGFALQPQRAGARARAVDQMHAPDAPAFAGRVDEMAGSALGDDADRTAR